MSSAAQVGPSALRTPTGTGRVCAALTGAVLLSSLLAACSNDSDTAAGGTPKATPTSSTKDVTPPEKTEVKMSTLKSADFLPLYIGIKQGLYKNRGITVTPVENIAPPAIPAALVNGSVDTTVLASRCEVAHRQGIPLVVAGMGSTATSYTFVVSRDVASLKDLAGKRVITSAAAAVPTILAHAVLADAGVEKDIEFLPIAAPPAQVAAFQAGQGSAVMVTSDDAARLLGQVPDSKQIAIPEGVIKPSPTDGTCVSKKFLAENPGTVYALVAGWSDAVTFMRKNEKETVAFMQTLLMLSPEQAAQVYDAVIDEFVTNPVPTDELTANQAELNSLGGTQVSASQVKSVYDLSIAEDVAKDLGVAPGS